jgi:hypothetical protein
MKTTLITLGLLILISAGCSSSAQLVRQDGRGGVVALQGAYMPAMQDARMLMVEHCGGRFEMLEQGDQLSFRCRQAPGEERVAQLAELDELEGRGL